MEIKERNTSQKSPRNHADHSREGIVYEQNHAHGCWEGIACEQ